MIAAIVAGCSGESVAKVDTEPTTTVPANAFSRVPLIGDASVRGTPMVDPNLHEPWGLAFSRSGVLWITNNTGGTSTLYDTTGTPMSRVITVPHGSPTGIVSNSSSDFVIAGGPATWMFAGEYGVISAWNSSGEARIVIDNSALGASYKGLALAPHGTTHRLYAANFTKNRVEVYDASFKEVTTFTDPDLPEGYAPFNVEYVGGQLYVTFARQVGGESRDDEAGAGHGYVDIFTTDGALVKRFASNGTLNSPWAVTVAPPGFGPFAGKILVGNFGDGQISVFDPAGGFVDVLRDEKQAPITVVGLWGMGFSPVGGSPALYFTSCPDGNFSGVIGTLNPR